LGHGQKECIIIHKRLAARDPVDAIVVAEVLVERGDVVEGVELVVGALAGRGGGARVQREGEERVTASEAVGTNTALSVYYIKRSAKLTRQSV